MKQIGIFLAHLRSARIDAHFQRLADETRSILPWTMGFNPGRGADLDIGVAYEPAAKAMPRRWQAMVENGGVRNGLLDVAIFSSLLAIEADHVWVVEYDVDFAGRWSDFFTQFENCHADLLTTSVVSQADMPGWHHWPRVRAPVALSETQLHRAFLPIMRLSRRMVGAYVREVNAWNWTGHYEAIVPTVAIHLGLHVEDIGGTGRFCPEERRGKNYSNNIGGPKLNSGSFIFRPIRPRYFHESPQDFEQKDLLYHPVKADVAPWEI
ncbi:hypothetical protein [Methylorubrum sp. SB2]|uniref:hypothetical protein n=1 Tax=Methylorubrum subtropicum TaxID=3138812 RepID=UPI00313D8A96